jgi:hypothetical protein
MSHLRKVLLGLVLAAVGAGTLLVPALPAAASSTCDFTMVSLKARNLLDDGGDDYAWLKVDQTWFPAGNNGVKFYLGSTHTPILFGYPYMGFSSSGLEVKVVLDVFGFSNHTVGTTTIACSPRTNYVHTFDDGDAIYDMTYTVT